MTRTGMGNLITRLRTLAGDDWVLQQDTATGDGSTKAFWLNHRPEAAGGTISAGGTVQTITTRYTWDTAGGKVNFVTAPANGVALVAEYNSARFTDAELQDVLDSNVTRLEDYPLVWLQDRGAGGTIGYYRAAVTWRDMEEASSGTLNWVLRDYTGAQVGTANYTPNYVSGEFSFTADQAGSARYLTARSYDLYGAAADLWQRRAAGLVLEYDFASDQQRFSRSQMVKAALEMAQSLRRRAGQNRGRGAVQSNVFVRRDLNRSV